MRVSVYCRLFNVVKHISNPSDCSSSERCILAYLYDLFACCYYVKAKFGDTFAPICSKVKSVLYAPIQPSASNLLWQPGIMQDLIENPKVRPEPALIRQLNDSPANRYSFVCNALLNISNTQNLDKLNEVSILCAELTASCTTLGSEWLGVLKALCCSSNHNCGFIDVLTQVDVSYIKNMQYIFWIFNIKKCSLLTTLY